MNLRKLYEHLNPDARRILQRTADMAVREQRRSISIEFFLLSLIRDKSVGPTVMKAIDDADGDAPAIESALVEQVANESTLVEQAANEDRSTARRGLLWRLFGARWVVNEDRSTAGALPSFDESLAQLLREAWSLSFDEYGEGYVTPVRFFETVARRSELWPKLVTSLPGFGSIDPASLAVAGRADGVGDESAAWNSNFPELSRYGQDMIAQAREGGFDAVVGLQRQMRAMAYILLRRGQNSVVVVGESGVGKTACAMSFIDAMAHKKNTVPEVLHDTPVWSVNVSALCAGAEVRGTLEERLQAIVAEVEGTGMILYIDDIHLLFGEQSGGGDVLRNVLSDGSVRILGTCGWREWHRHIEPDASLARHVASVRIEEPDNEEALQVVSGIAPKLAEHHHVEFGDNVLASSVALSRRYIVDRQLPDKAIFVFDLACARVRMGVVGLDEADKGKKVTVTEDDVASVVSGLTGVPIGDILSDISQDCEQQST